jgi:hypothetical protein
MKISATQCFSGRQWQAIPNSSWGERYKEQFGDRSGFVICYNNKHQELTPLCSIIGQPFVPQQEIDANARLIALAPQMAKLVEKLAILDEKHYRDIAGFIIEARELSKKLIL